jgi:hypothetical protein
MPRTGKIGSLSFLHLTSDRGDCTWKKMVFGTIVLILLATLMESAECLSADSVHSPLVGTTTDSISVHRGTMVQVITSSGKTFQGKFSRKTSDELYLVISDSAVMCQIARDSVRQVNIFGTGSVENALLLGTVGFAFGYLVGYLIDHSDKGNASDLRKPLIGFGCASLGVLSGATNLNCRARLSADEFWKLPATHAGTAENAKIGLRLILKFQA